MQRDINQLLLEWKDDPRRRPILLRGARQVGKSYTVRSFAKKHFSNIVEIDFELQPQMMSCFTTLEPKEINDKISILTQKDICHGETLLFFDEIQQCPMAMKALRYYYEKMPQLHVIAAGSLLEFLLHTEKIEVPVGRIQYLYMKPLSFAEFCEATGESRLRKMIAEAESLKEIGVAVHKHALTVLKKYLVIGGMPNVVNEYIASENLRRCQQVQLSIIQTYRDDFGKYASMVKHKYLQAIFSSVPKMVGRKFKYSQVDNEFTSRELKNAIELLERAGVVQRVYATNGDGLPLGAGVRERHFKAIFLDVGLMQNMCGYQGDIINAQDILSIHNGAVAEQFVGQELLAYHDPYRQPALYYWMREAKNSSAEVDYLTEWGSHVVPIEVKSGPGGKLKSLKLFMEKFQTLKGIAVSQRQFECLKNLTFLPLYGLNLLTQSNNNLQAFEH
ncbi:MAG: ATP-binding protein [Deltaproteobacteria bacterium]|nr:ATP-binding protein [Deltaproteobacteria bacterium]